MSRLKEVKSQKLKVKKARVKRAGRRSIAQPGRERVPPSAFEAEWLSRKRTISSCTRRIHLVDLALLRAAQAQRRRDRPAPDRSGRGAGRGFVRVRARSPRPAR